MMTDKDKVVRRLLGDTNPMHICLQCDNYLGFRGFCSKKCHDQYYDELYEMTKEEVKQ